MSLGAHGVLLSLPWLPSANEAENRVAREAPPELTVDVAVLPRPQPPAEPMPPVPVARPAAVAPVATEMRPRAMPPVPSPVPSPVLEEIPPTPTAPPVIPAAPVAEPLPLEPEPVAEPVAEPLPLEPEPVAEPVAEPLPLEPEPVAEPVAELEPYADFPHVQGAQPADCGGDACWASPVDGGWRGAARSLQNNLESQGYSLSNITGEVLSTETGVRIYRVARDGEDPYYLNLVSVTAGILYSLTPAPITEDRLLALQAM